MSRFALLLLLLISAGPFLSGQDITFSDQPKEGPGGSNYDFPHVTITDRSEEPTGFVLFEPFDSSQMKGPEVAPVVIFMHGYGAYNPLVYGKWIEHLVKKGSIVIFPRYQKNLFSPSPDEFVANTLVGIRDALDTLCSQGHVLPDTSAVTMVGHSFGGAIIATILGDWKSFDIPKPKGAFLASPGTGPFKFGLESYENIPEDISLLVMVSSGDKTVGDAFGIKVYETAVNTPKRNLLRQTEDGYGNPSISHGHNESYAVLEAFDNGDHGFSYQRSKLSTVDVVDYYGYWKLMDALNSCVRSGEDCNYAFGNTSEQTYLGEWSDGTPVKPLDVLVPQNAEEQVSRK
ncbi:MAG: hypothetical protein R2879_08960 [Saprospiraceae bacterium]